MKHRQLDESEFLKDIATHRLKIIRDDGLYRHLRFKRPDTRCRQFDIVTWPGYLAYVGDMGDFVFSRVRDMLMFFRDDSAGPLAINPGYWSEKLQAIDRCGGFEEFDPEAFQRVAHEYRLEWVRDAAREGTLTKQQRRDLWEAVGRDVMDACDDGEIIAFQAARDFDYDVVGGRRGDKALRYRFDDFWEHNFKQYTHRFLWSCYAIVWGIRQYDLATELPVIAEKESP